MYDQSTCGMLFTAFAIAILANGILSDHFGTLIFDGWINVSLQRNR
jgi:hypothetical protein